MKKYFLILILPLFAISCQPSLENLLPGDNSDWEVERVTYELTWDFSLIESTDIDTLGEMKFLANGRGFWDNGKIRVKTDIIEGDSFRWAATENRVEIRFDLEQEEIDQPNNQLFDFQVLENERERQIWRHENEFKVFNPQKRDSCDARLIWQWRLNKKGE
ncbi:MAG: hypothetical protein MRZ79_22405 [Bacteroidia bacterium]|nr:hypothetical protein [Bacteroidia bacterium]